MRDTNDTSTAFGGQEKWLGTLTSVPNKGEKVLRHAPACLIGCAAYDRLRRAHERYRQTTDDRQTDGRTISYSERVR